MKLPRTSEAAAWGEGADTAAQVAAFMLLVSDLLAARGSGQDAAMVAQWGQEMSDLAVHGRIMERACASGRAVRGGVA